MQENKVIKYNPSKSKIYIHIAIVLLINLFANERIWWILMFVFVCAWVRACVYVLCQCARDQITIELIIYAYKSES